MIDRHSGECRAIVTIARSIAKFINGNTDGVGGVTSRPTTTQKRERPSRIVTAPIARAHSIGVCEHPGHQTTSPNEMAGTRPAMTSRHSLMRRSVRIELAGGGDRIGFRGIITLRADRIAAILERVISGLG
jgi:hypothetical protein